MATVDQASTEQGRIGKTDVAITYRIGQYQVGTVRIPKEDLTEEKVKEAIRKDVELHAKYLGMKFKV